MCVRSFQHESDRGGQRRRVLMRHDHADAVGQQLDGVREGGGHHRNPRGDGLDEHAGGDLFPGVVGQDDDVGGRDQRAQRGWVVVVRPVVHRMGDAQQGAEALQALPVRLALPLDDLGMGLSGDRVRGAGSRSRSRARARSVHSMPLPGPSSPQVSRCDRRRPRGRRAGLHRDAVRDDRHLGGVHVVADEQPVTARRRSSSPPRPPRRRPAPARAF